MHNSSDDSPENWIRVADVSGTVVVGNQNNVMFSVAAGMAAAPFLQAIATHFGTKLAGQIDEATRVAVRRFLRRESAHVQVSLTESHDAISLRTEAGWSLRVPVDIPAEALGQLLTLQGAPHPALSSTPVPVLKWRESAWWVVGVNNGLIVEHRWSPETGWSES
jgi:hypothetical protein